MVEVIVMVPAGVMVVVEVDDDEAELVIVPPMCSRAPRSHGCVPPSPLTCPTGRSRLPVIPSASAHACCLEGPRAISSASSQAPLGAGTVVPVPTRWLPHSELIASSLLLISGSLAYSRLMIPLHHLVSC